MKRFVLGVLCFCGLAIAQPVQQVLPNPDCQIFFAFTAAGQNSAAANNLQQGCTSWAFSYTVTGFSAVSVVLQSAPNSAGSPGSYATGFPVQQTVVSGSNPGTSTTAGFYWVQGVNAFARMHLTSVTGSGMVQGSLFGWRIPNAASQGGGGGAITCLTGDVNAGSGGGCTTATVVGIESVPFCSGYTPTNGQFVQYTTGSSPNPCYTAAPASSTTGNAASVVTYTPGSSVTLTCPSSSAGTVTVFAPGSAVPGSYTAMAANMAITWASCTTGQDVRLIAKQAASGGPYTISGLPSGAPNVSPFASAVTTYLFHASSATTVAFDNVAADSGPGVCTVSAAPGTAPPSGTVYTWCDSTDLTLHSENSSGAISTPSVAKTCSANQAFTAMTTAGVYTCAAISGVPSGSAGGDLGGTYPNPNVNQATPSGDFTVNMNSVVAVTLVNSGAVVNSIYSSAGNTWFNSSTEGQGGLSRVDTITTTPRGINEVQISTGTDSARLGGYKARGTPGSKTIVATGDFISRWSGWGYDGASYLECASVVMSAQGTVASTRVPGQIDFQTCTDAAPSVLTTAMTLDKAQNVKFPKTTVNVSLGTTGSTSTATPVILDLGGTFADAATGAKAKFKMYNDGTNIYGVGISAGQFNFFKDANGTYDWYFNNVLKMTLDGTGVLGLIAPPKFGGTNTTAVVAGVIGSTCPAVTCTSAYTWVQATAADGSTVYFPVWK